MLMRETADRGGGRMFGARLRHQDFAAAAVAHVAPHSAVKALAVVPKDIERPVFFTAARRWLRHRSHAAAVQNSSFNPDCMMPGFMIIATRARSQSSLEQSLVRVRHCPFVTAAPPR